MFGDMKVWSGTKEVTVVPWWYRVWRWVTRANSEANYKRVARMMDEARTRERMAQLQEVLNGRRATTGGDSGGQRDCTSNLREFNERGNGGV